MTFDRSNNISLKYQRFTTLGSKDIGIRKSEFVAKTQFLSKENLTYVNPGVLKGFLNKSANWPAKAKIYTNLYMNKDHYFIDERRELLYRFNISKGLN